MSFLHNDCFRFTVSDGSPAFTSKIHIDEKKLSTSRDDNSCVNNGAEIIICKDAIRKLNKQTFGH
jgi:hypothetical protein